MVDHTWGVDRSHFDSPGGAAEIVAEGFGFMTHKAGGDSPDAELNTWWNGAKPHRADILLGAYWVLYPNHGAGAGDAFIDRLDSQCPGWRDGPFILQLDCEEWNSDPSTMPDVGEIRACANRLRQLAPKLMPIVYAPKWAYGNSLSGLGYPLWSSAYTSAHGAASAIYPGDSYSGWDAYSGIVPTIAQFSSTATVNGDSTTDVNCFKGTQEELAALLAPGFVVVEASQVELADNVGSPARPNRTVGQLLNDLEGVRDWGIADTIGADPQYSHVTPTSPLGKMLTAAVAVPGLVTAISALQSAVASIQAQLTAGVTANVNVPALAAALDALLPDVTIDEATVVAAFRDMASAASAPAPVGADTWDVGLADTPIAADVTKQMRQDRQPGIQGS